MPRRQLNKFSAREYYDSKARRILVREFRLHNIEYHHTPTPSDSNGEVNYTFTSDRDQHFPNFPILIQSNGTPWEISTLYLLAKIKNDGCYEPRTIRGIADHLLDYLRFLEDEGLSFLHLPPNDRLKVTFRYRERLVEQMSLGLATSTAKARINTIVNFYRRIIKWKIINKKQIENPPFEDILKTVSTTSEHGLISNVAIASHNLTIKKPKKQKHPELICDGGDLRPLTTEEQEIVLKSLAGSSREYQLMFYLALFTGARIQTVCTLRIKDIQMRLDQHGNLMLPIGGGTDIDTKYDKTMTLLIPGWLVEDMKIYSLSQEAKKRRSRSFYGDSDNNYIFLSKNGIPYYTSKREIIDRRHRESSTSKSIELKQNKVLLQDGSALRQHIHSILLPRIHLNNPTFQGFRFHDLRASFGMNLLERQLIHSGDKKITAILEEVQQRMGHSSIETTLKYLNYKSRLEWRKNIQHEFESSLFKYVNTSNGKTS
ncbi:MULTISPECIES: tyrosine-type recombinase/integrase [unclassified Pseudomonas]|uniref:tyrosine-type recombinase/integrase n=1 Tax=unclassified Pseudomonas TaxID=196821 RepID=UPI0021BADD14|nr:MULTISPECIES: site-specific integrase [unclassified Pseudomonas]MCT8166766.1 site-specific integrase [Pseudomonas sp. HD6422]MCT8185685.1 site-specific integrase [Pseudomonas sp. HD6421]